VRATLRAVTLIEKRPRARPRFTLQLAVSPEVVVEKVRAHLAEPGGTVTGSVFRRTLLLTIVDAHRHFWTPHLDVQLDAHPEGGTRLSGTFAPHPQLWTLFVGIQLLFGLLSIAAAIWLTSQWMLGGQLFFPTLVLGAMLFGGGFSYGAAYVGQGFGSEQMYELRSFLDAALREE
jgi:hypothetical protein